VILWNPFARNQACGETSTEPVPAALARLGAFADHDVHLLTEADVADPQSGWINLRSMLIHGAEFFAFRPRIWLIAVGLLIKLAPSQGPLRVGGHTSSLYWMLLGMTLSIAGLQSFDLGYRS